MKGNIMNATNSSNYFTQLSAINVSAYVEQKGQFSYLSWPYAVSQLRQFDPNATWEVKRFDGLPYLICDLGVFVEVAVTVQGITLSQIHPVLDGKKKPLMSPSSFDINTSIQRCLVKAIALHGLGLSIYAGEDLPIVEGDESSEKREKVTDKTPNIPATVTPIPERNEPPRDNGFTSTGSITAAQISYIHRLIRETGTELQKVLDFCGVEQLEDIGKSEASRVIKSLEQSRTRKEAA
jgi:hypothetical protein